MPVRSAKTRIAHGSSTLEILVQPNHPLTNGRKIAPLRNMVLLQAATVRSQYGLTVIQPDTTIQRFTVLGCGPEVHDIHAGDTVLANRLAGTVLGNTLLVSESAILATL